MMLNYKFGLTAKSILNFSIYINKLIFKRYYRVTAINKQLKAYPQTYPQVGNSTRRVTINKPDPS